MTRDFNKQQSVILETLSALENRENKYTSVEELFCSSQEYLLAIGLQNNLHPKNNQRMQAVKDGSYVEIKSIEGAKCYLISLLTKNLETELKAAQSEVLAEFKALK